MKRVWRFVLGSVCGVFLALPAAALAGSISGVVSDNSVTHNGIPGIEVCARPEPYEFEESCTETGAGGAYALGGLPTFSYHLHFSSARNHLNYGLAPTAATKSTPSRVANTR